MERRASVEGVMIVDEEQVTGFEPDLDGHLVSGSSQLVKRGLRRAVEPCRLGEVGTDSWAAQAPSEHADRSDIDGIHASDPAQEGRVHGGLEAWLPEDVDNTR